MLEHEIVGQESLLSHLKQTVEKNQVPHAQLFIDKGGYGGLSLALYQAVLLLYEPNTIKDALGQGKSWQIWPCIRIYIFYILPFV